MSAYVGNYINHIIGSLNPTYVNPAILLLIISSKCSHVQYGCICKPLAFQVILVAFLKVSQLSSVPFLLVVMSLMLCVWRPCMYHKIKLSLWPCFQAKVLLVCFMTYFGYHVLFRFIYFVCTCFFMYKYLRDVVYLETYTHERWYIFSWYHSSLESTVFVLFRFFVAPKRIWLWVLVYF